MAHTAITTLMDDVLGDHFAMTAEHGLSFHVRTPQSAFLFDAGATRVFMENAAKLNLDLTEISQVICSHGHYDHTGGFTDFVTTFGCRRLITGRDFFLPKYTVDGFRHSFTGNDFTPGFCQIHGVEHHTVDDLMPIDDFCWVVGGFAVPEQVRPAGCHRSVRFMRLEHGGLVADRFVDEVCLAIRWRDGLAVLVGCSHPGIVSMLESVHQRLALPIRGVWGGVHLLHADAVELDDTIVALKRLGVTHFGLSHCSGENLLAALADDPDIVACSMRTGDGIFLE